MESSPWEKNNEWSLTSHAYERFTKRFAFTEKEINEVIELLKEERFVRVPEKNPREGRYVIQLVTSKGSIFLVCSTEANIIITVRKPFCHFPSEIPGLPIEAVDDGEEEEEDPKQSSVSSGKVKVVQMYKSLPGNLFETEQEALNDNLEFQLRKFILSHYLGSGNEFGAVFALLWNDREELMKILSGEAVYDWDK